MNTTIDSALRQGAVPKGGSPPMIRNSFATFFDSIVNKWNEISEDMFLAHQL